MSRDGSNSVGLPDDASLAGAEAAFQRRLARYRDLGHDRAAAVEWIVETAGLSGPVLDVGTGKGLLAVALARHGLDVTSVDPNAADQLLARERARRAGVAAAIEFVTGDAATVAAPPSGFASAAMMDVLHHLDPATTLFARLSALVRPGGRLLLAEFDRDGFAIVARAHEEEGSVHDVGPVTMGVAVAALCAHGWNPLLATAKHQHELVVLERS